MFAVTMAAFVPRTPDQSSCLRVSAVCLDAYWCLNEASRGGAFSSQCLQVRVMPKCWYVLLRFFLRVDGVLVKLRETRIFCPFTDDRTVGPIIRELKYSEGTFEELSKAGAPTDRVRCITFKFFSALIKGDCMNHSLLTCMSE